MSFMKEAGITREPPFFKSLRLNDWVPRFHWGDDVTACADAINRPHEDYPDRVADTERAIRHVMELNQKAHGNLVISQDLITSTKRRKRATW